MKVFQAKLISFVYVPCVCRRRYVPYLQNRFKNITVQRFVYSPAKCYRRRRQQANSNEQACRVQNLTENPNVSMEKNQQVQQCDGVLEVQHIQKVCSLSTADEVVSKLYELFKQDGKDFQPENLSAVDCHKLLQQCMQNGNYKLSYSIYEQMLLGGSNDYGWPSIDLKILQLLVVGLAKGLQVNLAKNIVNKTNFKELGSDVSFGFVVTSPLPPCFPLAVVQPGEGSRQVACSESRYLFSLYSGICINKQSEALSVRSSALFNFLRRIGFSKHRNVEAIHELIVQSSDGSSQTFRFGSESPEVPAVEGDNITIICAGGNMKGLIDNSPPGWNKGEVMQVSNHSTRSTLACLRAPPSAQSTSNFGLPSWMLPLLMLFAVSDTASSVIDPRLPLILMIGTVSVAGSAMFTTQAIWPELKRLPENSLAAEQQRQTYLRQYREILTKLEEISQEIADDIYNLAKLSALQMKMQQVGQKEAYGTRLAQVCEAMKYLEDQVYRKVELIDGYKKVLNQIEIEVELASDLLNEEKDIQRQLERLQEVELLAEDWKYQVEAKDELNRILNNSN
eukprot:TRINITY_DN7903_c0_g1_i3.p1 TRINITY_DN7903_c0_g1~~TRINITY_DN7903_c0_g1_i3.p1  ORF type:complete len:564 (-),score=31.16 TRINITY_DN7903_c0_g1_i3:1901-3592(-)